MTNFVTAYNHSNPIGIRSQSAGLILLSYDKMVLNGKIQFLITGLLITQHACNEIHTRHIYIKGTEYYFPI